MNAGERLLRLFFPARCLVCGKVIPAGDLFCASCAKDLPKTPFRRQYSLPGAGAEGFRVVAPMSYQGGFRKTISRFKFQGKRALALPLGRLMVSALDPSEVFDAVAWAPLTKAGKRKRGYDQSELLAKQAARSLGLPALPLLTKVKENATQHELSKKERAKNVKGVYRAEPGSAGKALLLIDDIVTTGATLCECAETLYAAGAAKVVGLCAADAPEPSQKD